MDDLEWMALAQHGVFTTRQAAVVGVDRGTLQSAVRRGRLRRLARGLYAAGAAPERVEDRHRELCRAVLLEYPDGVLAGHSAVVAHGLPTWSTDLASVLLLRPADRQVRRSGVLIRPVDEAVRPVRSLLGPVTPLPASLVQLAMDHGPSAGVVAADAALRSGLVGVGDLETEVARRAGHPHVQRASAMSVLVDPLAESPGESRLRVMMTTGGLSVESQVVVRDRDGAVVGRADFRIAGTNVLVEFDGAVKYADGGVDALVREKRREDRLRSLGWVVVRVTWRDLEDPMRLLSRIRRAVAEDVALRRPAL